MFILRFQLSILIYCSTRCYVLGVLTADTLSFDMNNVERLPTLENVVNCQPLRCDPHLQKLASSSWNHSELRCGVATRQPSFSKRKFTRRCATRPHSFPEVVIHRFSIAFLNNENHLQGDREGIDSARTKLESFACATLRYQFLGNQTNVG